jgi:hypothetical protein
MSRLEINFYCGAEKDLISSLPVRMAGGKMGNRAIAGSVEVPE